MLRDARALAISATAAAVLALLLIAVRPSNAEDAAREAKAPASPSAGSASVAREIATGAIPVSEGPSGSASTDSTAAATPSPVPADPIVDAARLKVVESAVAAKSHKDDIEAIAAFYAERSGGPLWVDKNGFTAKAKDAMGEVRKAEDWGLAASSFDLPTLPPGEPTTEALGEAESRLGLELLKYVRHARGGRFDPASLSRILDLTPPVKDPKTVIAELAATDAPAIYLRGLHPKHEQFERLRQALIKMRGRAEKEEPVDEALLVKLPSGKVLTPGAEHADVALLRKRLKVPAEAGSKETLFDEKLADAVKAFQKDKGLKPSGVLNGATRRALNREGEREKPNPDRDVQRVLVNMERWRWMPETLGSVYVWDNIPEYTARVVKDGEEIFKEKIIVGLPEWATPVFSAEMNYVIFNPSWGVPDGIKLRELLPRLKSASGGFFFFGGGGGDVLRAYGLTAYRGGRPVDPDGVDWGSVDIRNYSFVQPPGGKNPLGVVKFRFPNKWDVYMHDTVQRDLFNQSSRALSHGCIRVDNPRKLAALLLAEGKGWSPDKVADALRSGGEITLDKPMPVHITYFTAMADGHGKVSTYGDIYGHDSRLAAALSGRPIRFEEAVAAAPDDNYEAAPAAKEGRKGKKSTSTYSGSSSMAEAVSGLLAN